jgi:hypothetical protein
MLLVRETQKCLNKEEKEMVITIQNFLELKKIMEDRCHTEIHYHESCDRQHFSADKALSGEAKALSARLFLQMASEGAVL